MCHAPIKAVHNVPLLGFLLQGGRCHSCGGRISLRYPVIELIAASLAVAIVPRATSYGDVALTCIFCWILLAISVIDLEHGIIPDLLTGSLLVLGLVKGLVLGSPLEPMLGAAIGGGGLYLIALTYRMARRREGLGLGDVKLLAGVGAYLGWQGSIMTLLIGSAAATLAVAAVAIWIRPVGRTSSLPFAPFLSLGAAVAAISSLA